MKYLWLLLLLSFLGSCGTEIGNPIDTIDPTRDTNVDDTTDDGNDDDDDDDDDDGGKVQSGSAISQISSAVCNKLAECNSDITGTSTCLSALGSVDGFDVAFDFTSDYTDLDAIDSAVTSGGITFSNTDLSACLSEINDLSCSSTEVTSAYDNKKLYTDAAEIIVFGGQCEALFVEANLM